MANREEHPIEETTDFTGESTLAGWIVGWSGHEYPYRPQTPKIRIKTGPLEVRMSFNASYLVAHIAITEDGNTIHHIALNPREKG